MNRKEIEDLKGFPDKESSDLIVFPRSTLTTPRYLLRKLNRESPLLAFDASNEFLNMLTSIFRELYRVHLEDMDGKELWAGLYYFNERQSLSETVRSLEEDHPEEGVFSEGDVRRVVDEFLRRFCELVEKGTGDQMDVDSAHEIIRTIILPMIHLQMDFEWKMRLEKNPRLLFLRWWIKAHPTAEYKRELQQLEDEEQAGLLIDESELMRRWGKRSDPPA